MGEVRPGKYRGFFDEIATGLAGGVQSLSDMLQMMKLLGMMGGEQGEYQGSKVPMPPPDKQGNPNLAIMGGPRAGQPGPPVGPRPLDAGGGIRGPVGPQAVGQANPLNMPQEQQMAFISQLLAMLKQMGGFGAGGMLNSGE